MPHPPLAAPGTLGRGLTGCARCHADHPVLTWTPFRTPPQFGVYTATHWALCPNLGEPVLFCQAHVGDLGAYRAELAHVQAIVNALTAQNGAA